MEYLLENPDMIGKFLYLPTIFENGRDREKVFEAVEDDEK
jgi:hypothetical protein